METNIAFIFIGTNKYIDFFEEYYKGVTSSFLPHVDKTIYAFTDDPDNPIFDKENTKTIQIEHKPWPYITLKRFNFICEAEDELKEFTDIIFLDADMVVDQYIPDEFTDQYDHYFGVHHPGQFMYGDVCEFEKNVLSTACIKGDTSQTKYHQGCFWGGKNPYILDMIKELKQKVEEDLENDFVAAWHDESHLNRFFYDNKEKVFTFHSGFAYPQEWDLDLPKFIIHLDKNMAEYPRFRGAKNAADNR
ncbi:hypothetical protein CL634_05365 [bacterium]|nr:hypothetical protein [bacterium]